MAVLIGIDFGLKRTGIAVTDTLQLIASPLEMIPTENLMGWLRSYVTSHHVAGMVIGFPISLSGEDTHITQNVRWFKEDLEKELPHIPVYLQDERHSSQRAAQTIHQVGKKKHGRNKGIIDKVSAAIILQDYLNERSTY
jgi:putative Holliday junction resolvase